MQQQDLDQVRTIIENVHTQKKKIPYLHDLQAHAVFGHFFQDLNKDDQQAIKDLIHSYIESTILNPRTKGGEMFQRFYVLNQDNFRIFRDLNADENCIETKDFQEIGKDIEQQLFKFEGILTQNMMKKPHGLDKVVSAFYDIVYSFFPLYGHIH